MSYLSSNHTNLSVSFRLIHVELCAWHCAWILVSTSSPLCRFLMHHKNSSAPKHGCFISSRCVSWLSVLGKCRVLGCACCFYPYHFLLCPVPSASLLLFMLPTCVCAWLSTLLSTGSSSMILVVVERSFSNWSLELAFLVSLGISCSCPSHSCPCYTVQFTVTGSRSSILGRVSFIPSLGESHLFEMFLHLFPGVRQCRGCLSPSSRLLCIICSPKRMMDWLSFVF